MPTTKTRIDFSEADIRKALVTQFGPMYGFKEEDLKFQIDPGSDSYDPREMGSFRPAKLKTVYVDI